MLTYFLQGLLLGLAYVVPIGIQNLYINSALRENYFNSLKTAFIVVFFDVSLALACFFGVGVLIDKFLIVKKILLLFGGVAIIYIGYKLITSKPEFVKTEKIKLSWWKIITTCFLVTWINPQAVIDGSLLLGGYRASLPISEANLFISGVTLASFLWFTGLATITSIFRKVFSKNVLRAINIVCGIIIVIYGIKLGISFFEL